MSKKQCVNCKHAQRPTKRCACNNKTNSLHEAVIMKFNGNGMQYCDEFKQRKN